MATEPSSPATLDPLAATADATEREVTVEHKNKDRLGQIKVGDDDVVEIDAHLGHRVQGDIVEAVNPDGSVTYTKRVDAAYQGGVEVESKIASAEVGVAVGTQRQYQVTIPKGGVGAVDPATMTLERMADADIPVGTTLSVDVAAYGSVELAGHYKEIAAEVDYRRESGVGMAVEKTGENRVRVTIGPRDALDTYGGAGLSFGGTDARLLLGLGYRDESSKFKSAEFDLSTPDGRKAYEQFTRSGTVPDQNSPDGKSVTGVRTVETRENALDLSVKFTAEVTAERRRADGSVDEIAIKSENEWSLARRGNSDVVIRNADGSTEIIGTRTLTGALVPDGSTEIRQKIDKYGNREETLVSKAGDTPWLTVTGNYARDGSGESLRTETHGSTTVEVAKKFGPRGVEDTAERRYTITLPADDAAALNAAFGKNGQSGALAEDGKNVVITLTEAEAAQWQQMARDAGAAMTTEQIRGNSAIGAAVRDPKQTPEQFIAELTSGPHAHPREIARNLAGIAEHAGSSPKYDKAGAVIETTPIHKPLPGAVAPADAQDRAAQAPVAQTPAAQAPTTQDRAPQERGAPTPATPTTATAHTAADRNHPDHPLLQKTDAGVREIDRGIGKPWDGDSERLSASAFKLAVAMNCKPGDDIAVGLNRQSSAHAAGALLMVHRQGANASPDPSANFSAMPIGEALAKPADQRLQEADAIRQGQNAQTQRQQAQQERAQEDVRPTRAPAAQ